ncbi:hypothetical protein [Halobacteriovorax sp. RZ-2]|uniref:hypothetical protein n=1 Tax=unclassified Halobacteriovorax TaxID=2639665 RepID=UPI003715FE2C
MKSIIIMACAVLSLNTFAQDIFTAKGKSLYFHTHSRVANILASKNAELEAFEMALNSIVDICGGENFRLHDDVKFHHRIDFQSPSIMATAEQKFSCINF